MLSDYRRVLSVMLPMTLISSCVLLAVLFYQLCLTPSYQDSSFGFWEKSNGHESAFRLFKRHVQQSDKLEHIHRCVRATPSRTDIEKLCRREECQSIYCLRPPSSSTGCPPSSVNTTCFTQSCSVFDVTVKDTPKAVKKQRISLDQLSGMIDKHGHDADRISINCSDSQSFLLGRKLFLEITSDTPERCNPGVATEVQEVENDLTELRNESSLNFYVVYFRFLSRWESYFKLPQLNTFIKHKRQDPLWNVHSFDNMQSISLGLDQNIHWLLRGWPNATQNEEEGTGHENYDLIQEAIDTGRCAVFNYIACHSLSIYEELFNSTFSEQNAKNCKLHSGKQFSNVMRNEMTNLTFCNSDDDGGEDLNIEDALSIDDHLTNIYSGAKAKLFSLSIINTLDLSVTRTFDSSLTKMLSDILSRPTSVVVIVSDVGDPRFTEIDESVFLRTQMYNPLLHVFLPRGIDENENLAVLTAEISQARAADRNSQLISLPEVFRLTRGLILSEEPRHSNDHRSINSTSRAENTQNGRNNAVCPATGIKGPIECLCLGRHVRFPNDSVQAAFATFVVGSINNRLSDLSSSYAENMDQLRSSKSVTHDELKVLRKNKPNCDRLVGNKFFNAQHVLWRTSTFVLITVYLRQSTQNYSDPIRVNAEVEYTTKDGHRADFSVRIINPLRIPVDILLDSNHKHFQKLLHQLCRQPDDLSMNFASNNEFLKATLRQGHFNGVTRPRSIHHPCLYLITTTFADSAVVEVVNICVDRVYLVTCTAELFNVLSLTALPIEMTVRPRDVQYVTSLVKPTYGSRKTAYKIKATYKIIH